jgi:hypothetical protein
MPSATSIRCFWATAVYSGNICGWASAGPAADPLPDCKEFLLPAEAQPGVHISLLGAMNWK